METRIDKIYKYGRLVTKNNAKIESAKLHIEQQKLIIQKRQNYIKSYESQIKMIKKHLEDNPILKEETK